MALTEEQRQENKKSMTKYMSVVFGGVFSYFFGYTGSMMQEEAQGIGAAIGTVISSLTEKKILYPMNGLAMLGIGIGLITIFPIYFFLQKKIILIKQMKLPEPVVLCRRKNCRNIKIHISSLIHQNRRNETGSHQISLWEIP